MEVQLIRVLLDPSSGDLRATKYCTAENLGASLTFLSFLSFPSLLPSFSSHYLFSFSLVF